MEILEQPLKKPSHLDNYKIKNVIGNGAFGKVKLATHIFTNENVAIKTIKKANEKNIQVAKDEIGILTKVSHPNIMKVYEIIETEEEYNIVSEYVSGGELLSYVEKKTRLCQNEIALFFFQIVNAVNYLHNNEQDDIRISAEGLRIKQACCSLCGNQ